MSPETEALLREADEATTQGIIPTPTKQERGSLINRLATALRAAEARADANAKDAERWRLELAQLVGSDDPKELKGMALMMGAFADSQPEAHRAVQALLTYHRARAQEVDRG